MVFAVNRVLHSPGVMIRLRVEQNHISNVPVIATSLRAVAVCACTTPTYLTQEALFTEDRVEHDLQIVARGGVAVQVEAPGRLEHPVQLHQPRGHHHQVRHHVVVPDEPRQRPEHFGDVGRRVVHQVAVRLLGRSVPLPGIGERFDLRGRGFAAALFEQHVVVALGIERGIEVDQIDGFRGEVMAEDVEVVAIEQRVPIDHRSPLTIAPSIPSVCRTQDNKRPLDLSARSPRQDALAFLRRG